MSANQEQQDQRPVYLITGGARRIGAAVARELVRCGCRVVIHYHHSGAAAAQLQNELNHSAPGSAAGVAADLADFTQLEQLTAKSLACFGRLDGLVNNASVFYPTTLTKASEANWDDLFNTNLKAPFFLSRALAPLINANSGAIVNIVDIHAERPLAGYPIYSTSKSALAGLTRALAIELAPNIRVNGVSPGAILWPEDDQFSAAEQQRIIEHSLLKREGTASDIATSVRFLLLEASYVTGHILVVDGGRSAAI